MNKLKQDAMQNGAIYNYIAWHSIAHTGKPLSVGWLCRLLSLLYRTPTGSERIFNSVIVVTNRKILKKQIRKNRKKLEKTVGAADTVERTTEQLRTILQTDKSIIISRAKKFSAISGHIRQMKNRRFAVIVDVADSLQQNEPVRCLNKFFSKTALGRYCESEEDRAAVDSLILQPHISYFGFNGTPGDKTLKIFEIKTGDTPPESIEFYSMKQRYLGSICAGCCTKLFYL